MKMARVDAIVAPAGGSVALKPGGYHIMLFGASQLFKEGKSYSLILAQIPSISDSRSWGRSGRCRTESYWR